MIARRFAFSALAFFAVCFPAVAGAPHAAISKEKEKDSPPVQVKLDVVIAQVGMSALRHADLEWEALVSPAAGVHTCRIALGKQEKYLSCLETLKTAGVIKFLAEPRL